MLNLDVTYTQRRATKVLMSNLVGVRIRDKLVCEVLISITTSVLDALRIEVRGMSFYYKDHSLPPESLQKSDKGESTR